LNICNVEKWFIGHGPCWARSICIQSFNVSSICWF